MRSLAVLLAGSAESEPTGTAVKLAERLLARGHRVAVFAHEDAVTLSARTSATAPAVGTLLRRGVHGGTLDWVVDDSAAGQRGVAGEQVRGVVVGDYADWWTFVQEADVVLSPPGAGAAATAVDTGRDT